MDAAEGHLHPIKLSTGLVVTDKLYVGALIRLEALGSILDLHGHRVAVESNGADLNFAIGGVSLRRQLHRRPGGGGRGRLGGGCRRSRRACCVCGI